RGDAQLPSLRFLLCSARISLMCSSSVSQNFFFSASLGSTRGRTTRKPSQVASVWYQMDLGICGSCTFQSGSEPTRRAERQSLASSSHPPPRATTGYSSLGQLI